MRKNFIYFVLVPLFLLFLCIYLFADKWIENSIEEAGEEIIGARVEIDGLKLSFFPLGIEWKAMRVANPNATWENLFETKKVKFAMDVNQLLRNKYIIETIEVHNLIVGTKRTTDGALPEGKKKQSIISSAERNFTKLAEDALKKTLGSNPIFDINKLKKGFNPDSLIAGFDIKTVNNIDSLKKKVDKAVVQWNGIKNDFERTKSRVVEIESNIKAINVNELNNAQNILSAVTTVDKAISSLNEINSTITKTTKTASDYINLTASSIDSIEKFVKYDFDRIKNAARIPTISTPGVAQLLVGSEMFERIKKYLYWVDLARSNIKKYSPEPEIEKPLRFEGQNIKFPIERGYPKLWIKNVLLTYGDEDKSNVNTIKAKGEAKNITDNQMVTGLPMTIALEGAGDDVRKLSLTGLFDRRKNIPLDEYTAKLAGVPVGEFKIGKSDFLPSTVKDAVLTTALKISVPGNEFDSKINFNLSNVSVNFEAAPKNIAESIVHEVLKSIKEFNLELKLWTTSGEFEVALATNLDELISKKLVDVIGVEFQKLQDDLKRKFYSYIQQEKEKFEKQYGFKITEIKNQIDSYQTIIADKTNFIEAKKKELTAKLEKEKNNFIEDKIKDIFKKR
ncbi:MAG: hypothetical protein C0412_03105 [Flavobacterium sp.]|nr:hypothetical protein [Flavobacterium sp.]